MAPSTISAEHAVLSAANVDPDSFPVARCSGFSCRFLCFFFVVALCGGFDADLRYDFALLPLYGVRLVTYILIYVSPHRVPHRVPGDT